MWGDTPGILDGFGTAGQDTFVFAPNNGNDTIFDYQRGVDNPIELDGFFTVPIPTHALDHIPQNAASHFLVPETFSDLNIQQVDANNDGITDSVIHFAGNNSVTVLGVTGLTAADFHFVI
jgi:hypothetical protein